VTRSSSPESREPAFGGAYGRCARPARGGTGGDSQWLPVGCCELGVLLDALRRRAALSEEDRNAKTHSGTWGLFQEMFVATRRFPEELFADAPRTQRLREAADYDAVAVSGEEA
jgi:hypothetical protein